MTRCGLLAIFLCAPAIAQNDSIASSTPVQRWAFDAPPFSEPGPRAPSYPTFSSSNTAALSGPGKPVLTVSGDDPTLGDALRFDLHDEMTLEAWVRVDAIRTGSFDYLLGKGRTAGKGEKNQNYALRLKGEADSVKLNFLFASAAVPGWHRWTSTESFPRGSWHHVAVSYVFGKPDSLHGYIDGQPVKGTWDMDGSTDRAPISDNADLILGTGNGNGTQGHHGNAFTGALDDVAIWREVLAPEVIASRYQHVPPPPVIAESDVPAGHVLTQLCEQGIPASAKAWPPEPPPASETYHERAFGLFELPHRYVGTGVRGDRSNPLLIRTAAHVDLPAGKHRLLLRARGGSRLYIDQKLILTTPFNTEGSDGHGRISEQVNHLDLGPDFRFAPPGNREEWCHFESDGRTHFVVMESLVGGAVGKSFRRPELGEIVVAWAPQGSDQWQLLTPGKDRIPYTDESWAAYARERQTHLASLNAKARATLRSQNAPYWQRRRDAASHWLASTPDIKIPALPPSLPAHNPIDHFLGAKIASVSTQLQQSATATIDFHRQIAPILANNCLSCHQGGKAKGDLQLDSLTAALRGGESDGPAVTPGDPQHSALLARVTTSDEDAFMPPKGAPLASSDVELIRQWIQEGAHWPELDVASADLTPLTDDLTFLRRIHLDTVGVPPSLKDITAFQANPDRNAQIDSLLNDPRWADHWMGYWQDVLAENPNILNPTLNNSGPFRWWIHESLLDNKPMDLFVTELLRMEGSERFGGPAGFGIASQNDVPMAAKAIIVGSAFLGVEMKCARCHDSPSHSSTQEQLFQLAAMLGNGELDVPASSSVPMDRFHGLDREPLIQVTLQPGTTVPPAWPFAKLVDEARATALAQHADNTRDRLAALITAPQNERFAQVIVNRLWARLMGRGIVANPADWEKSKPSHPELLAWLGRELVRSGYDLKATARLILQSHAYQRATDPHLTQPSPLFNAPASRRLDAEQIVDSLFATTGKPFVTEEVSLDIDGARDLKNSLSLGHPTRAWMLTSTSNERDRPSLALPRIQAVADVMTAFGWRGARQDATTLRDADPNSLQPAILANGVMTSWLSTLSDDHGITGLALTADSPGTLIDTLFLRLLTRLPTPEEKQLYTTTLTPGFESRKSNPTNAPAHSSRQRPKYVSWSNHLDPEATLVRQQQEADARRGDPPTDRLSPDWRLRMEDVLWSLLNAPEALFVP